MSWLIVACLLDALVATPGRGAQPKPAKEAAAEGAPQPSGYVHLVQASDRIPKIAAYYGITERELREVNADLFAYNEAHTGHRMVINEPIILPMGCFIPRSAAYARRADALDKPADPTVITTPDSPASQDGIRTGSGWAQQYSARKSRGPLFKPAAPPPPAASEPPVPAKADKKQTSQLAYGITTSDLPSPKGKAGTGANRHARLSSVFGWRSGRRHKGIDIPMDANTPVAAARDGTVERADYDLFGYGYFVIISHGRAETRYAHLNRLMVRQGQHVTGGKTIIGLSGDTGHSTGPHLHFELRVDGEAVDPVGVDLPGVQAMLSGSAAAAGKDDLSGGFGSLNYTFAGDKRWQLQGGW